VTLEPCSHLAKTPPCADLLIEKKIKRCIIALQDPYKEVNGLGIKKLRDAGIEVEVGVLEDEAKELNKFFIKHVTSELPYLTMKLAMSLDGKIALRSGVSKYITSEASRTIVHEMRAQYDAVMVASATVIADDPELTVRLVEGRQPKRIILDASLRIPLDKKIFSDDHRSSTIVIVNESVLSEKREKIDELEANGVTLVPVHSVGEQLDLITVFETVSKQGIASILIEPGPTLATTLLQSGLLDEVVLFYAPLVLGDDAGSAFGELHLRSITDAGRFRLAECRHVEGSNDFYVNLRMQN
jgi:diaminohydroxyphosphoribosylaminopyrimidine deaminase/5-amino-6-(5-phosphoribosylamino)uracil reductase